MKIEIETNGDANATVIKLNDEVQEKIVEFGISVRAGKKLKMSIRRDRGGKTEFLSYFGEDFREFDRKIKEEGNYVGAREKKT